MTKQSDAEILAGLKRSGSERISSQTHLYEQYFGMVWKALDKHVIEKEEALSAYSDAIMDVIGAVEQGAFRGESPIGIYLYRVYTNKIIDAIRRQRTRKEEMRRQVERELPLHLKSPLPNPEQALTKQDAFLDMVARFTDLGTHCKEILIDTEYYGYSAKETAERVGLKNANTLRQTKIKCMRRLRELLKIDPSHS